MARKYITAEKKISTASSVRAGVLERFGIAHMIGAHVHPGVQTGAVASGGGFVNAAKHLGSDGECSASPSPHTRQGAVSLLEARRRLSPARL